MSPFQTGRWTFTIPGAAGDVHAHYELTPDTLELDSDALWNGGHHSLPLAAVTEAGTTTVPMPVGPGAPDLGRYVPRELEWLVASRSDAGRSFMGPLPAGPERERLIEALRARLGTRWVGEGVPLEQARTRFGLPLDGQPLKVIGLVVGVLVLLVLMLLGIALLVTPAVLIPLGLLGGAWLARDGLLAFRDAESVGGAVPTSIGAARPGFVALSGRATGPRISTAAVSGRPSVFWDVGLDAASTRPDDNRGWQQLAARFGGTKDLIEIEDATGRVPIWLKDADLVVTTQTWEVGRDALPATAGALMAELGFAWEGRRRLRETRLDVGASLFVLGTLGERRRVPEPGQQGVVARVARSFRTGEWRADLVRGLPGPLRLVVAVFFTFLSIVLGVGRGGERPTSAQRSSPPDLPEQTRLIWKGTAGRPFVVSSVPAADTVAELRTRSLVRGGGGVALILFSLYELVQLF